MFYVHQEPVYNPLSQHILVIGAPTSFLILWGPMNQTQFLSILLGLKSVLYGKIMQNGCDTIYQIQFLLEKVANLKVASKE